VNKRMLSDGRLEELSRIRAFAVSFTGPEKAFILEELQALVEEVQERRRQIRIHGGDIYAGIND
jgi:hypothetical protein